MKKCRKCNEEIETDESSIGCDDFVSDRCVLSSEYMPFLDIEEGDPIHLVFLAIIEKLKEQNQIIDSLFELFNECCGTDGNDGGS